MDVLVTNRLEVVGVSNVMEEVVDVAYSYMDTSEQQQNLGNILLRGYLVNMVLFKLF